MYSEINRITFRQLLDLCVTNIEKGQADQLFDTCKIVSQQTEACMQSVIQRESRAFTVWKTLELLTVTQVELPECDAVAQI